MTDSSQAVLTTLLASVGDALLVVDANTRVVGSSDAFAALTDLPPQEVLALPAIAGFVGRTLAGGEAGTDTVNLPGRAGRCMLSARPVVENDHPVGCILLLQPFTTGTAVPREGFDRLTGLPNRSLFVDRIEQAIHNAGRGQKSVAVILTGIDRFGEIHDVLGESASDEVLREIAARLSQSVRTSDTVARLETDRFAFVMQIAAIDDSVLLTEKILRAFERTFALGQQQDVAIGCSVGVSIYPADGPDAETLIKNAGIALHHARRGGSGRCQYFASEMNDRARRRIEVESNIRRALTRSEFVVYYQPKINVGSGHVAGMEALIRWQDPQRGLVAPGEFIPVAEESGLIEQIGQWVLEETCAQNVRWQGAGLRPTRASVNVSARQFRNRDFVATVKDVLARTGLEPRWLELEITESMLMGDIDAIVARMEELRGIGVGLSIDDFGTGYSSLSYLARFPISTLKIDRAFIADVQTNPHTAEIARAIIGLSRGLNLEVVAEGAEVKEHVEFLRAHGCEVVQGFYYSRPLPADEFAVMLRDGASVA